jgi:uncharacterized membrane protein
MFGSNKKNKPPKKSSFGKELEQNFMIGEKVYPIIGAASTLILVAGLFYCFAIYGFMPSTAGYIIASIFLFSALVIMLLSGIFMKNKDQKMSNALKQQTDFDAKLAEANKKFLEEQHRILMDNKKINEASAKKDKEFSNSNTFTTIVLPTVNTIQEEENENNFQNSNLESNINPVESTDITPSPVEKQNENSETTDNDAPKMPVFKNE